MRPKRAGSSAGSCQHEPLRAQHPTSIAHFLVVEGPLVRRCEANVIGRRDTGLLGADPMTPRGRFLQWFAILGVAARREDESAKNTGPLCVCLCESAKMGCFTRLPKLQLESNSRFRVQESASTLQWFPPSGRCFSGEAQTPNRCFPELPLAGTPIIKALRSLSVLRVFFGNKNKTWCTGASV